MRIALMLAASWLLAGCAVGDEADTTMEPDDEGDAEPLTLAAESAASAGDFATVAQVNPYYGGRFSTLDIHADETYETARRFAHYVHDSWPRLSALGMEEIADPANAQQVAQILTNITGHPWAAQHFGRAEGAGALPATEEAILWRTDVWTPVENLGTREVAAVDTSRGPSTLSVRFGGLLLRRNGTSHELAMFTGKISWPGKRTNGRLLDNEDRGHQADVLMTWIDNKLASHPNATRVIAVDVNADRGTAPWTHFLRHFADGGDDRPTHWTYGARRIDGLFWDYDSGSRRSDDFGIVAGPYRSAAFGSDHRAIAARIRLR